MRADAIAKYAPALVMAPIGALDPIIGSIAFGMVTGWLAIAGVMHEQGRPFREIRRAMVTSLLIGGGGALFAMFAVSKLRLDPLGAAIASFTIAFGGVKAIKSLSGAALKVVQWVFVNLADDAEKIGRERAKAQRMLSENTKADRARLGLKED
nr:hypothetical protein [Novosphingobium panipatense]